VRCITELSSFLSVKPDTIPRFPIPTIPDSTIPILNSNAYRGGVGISDCIHSGEEPAEKLLERLTAK
jgi:hypothetical protein